MQDHISLYEDYTSRAWYVEKGTGPEAEIIKGPMSKKQADDFCKIENDKFYNDQVDIRKSQYNAGEVRRDRCILYKAIKK